MAATSGFASPTGMVVVRGECINDRVLDGALSRVQRCARLNAQHLKDVSIDCVVRNDPLVNDVGIALREQMHHQRGAHEGETPDERPLRDLLTTTELPRSVQAGRRHEVDQQQSNGCDHA